MTAALARAVMTLAIGCLGASRRDWACAMCGEFDEAVENGAPLRFATGCLIAAWRAMPGHAEGRAVLANYALALGVLIPMAALQIALVLGLPSAFGGGEPLGGALLSVATRNPLLFLTQVGAAPCLLALWLLLAVGHLRLAWALADSDWTGVTKAGALVSAALVTLFIVTAALALDTTAVLVQAAAIAAELIALVALSRRDTGLFANAVVAFPAR